MSAQLCYTGRMKTRRFRKWLRVIAILFAAAVPIIWFFPALLSYGVMSVYSATHHNTSVMKQNGFDIKMVSAEGWYPFVLTFNADGFSAWSGIQADMSILYCFGAFDNGARTSTLYDPQSRFYSAFYGAYAIKTYEGVYGFSDQALDIDEVITAVRYDYTQLVMRNFGCISPVFSVKEYSVYDDISHAGSDGWTRIDALMTLNAAAHAYEENKNAYIQYGRPPRYEGEDFPVIEMAGRVYAKFFDEYGCTVMLYVMAPDWLTVDECDAQVLAGTVISGL